MKPALDLIRDNIKALLEAQQMRQRDLSFAVGKDYSWINKILNGHRGLDVSELNAIADFFHIEPYQLLQPGIHKRTERRSGADRRSGRDRRETPVKKTLRDLRTRLKLPTHGDPFSALAQTVAGFDDETLVHDVVQTLVDHVRLHQRPGDRTESRPDRSARVRVVAANRQRTNPKSVKE